MQRCSAVHCQQLLKQAMKKLVVILLLLSFVSCNKENTAWISGTVIQQGCDPATWAVKLEAPDRSKHPFLCDPFQSGISSSSTHCGNTVIILNMPPALAIPGKKVKFSQWQDKGLHCFSSILAPHHLEVYDIRAK